VTEDRDAGGLRVGDADRELAVARLREAVVEGRLTLDEFGERVGEAQAARTATALARLTEDLPAPPPALPPPASRHRAICSRLVRSGLWELPAHSAFSAIFGTIELDLRHARLRGAESEISIFNLFGTVTILVPEHVRVQVDGGGPFASQVVEPTGAALEGVPVLHVHTTGSGGTLYVRTRRDGS
jgi:DUF1707 SHOCT-like domain/Cell wall-active antibiotics response LiaF, C-terminal